VERVKVREMSPEPKPGDARKRPFAEFCCTIPSSESAVASMVDAVRKLMQLLAVEEEWSFRVELSPSIHPDFEEFRIGSPIRILCVITASLVKDLARSLVKGKKDGGIRGAIERRAENREQS